MRDIAHGYPLDRDFLHYPTNPRIEMGRFLARSRATLPAMAQMKMVHPHLPDDQVPARVDSYTFEKVWEPKGWTEYVEPPKPVEEEADTPDPPARRATRTIRRAEAEVTPAAPVDEEDGDHSDE